MGNKDTGARVRQMRHFRNMSAAELGAFVPLSESRLCDLERGEYAISRARLLKIAHALDASPHYLLTGNGSPVSEPTESEIKNPSAPSPALLKRASTAYAACDTAAEPHTSGWGGDMLVEYDAQGRTFPEAVIDALRPKTPIQRVEKALREKKPAPIPSDVYGCEDDTKLIAAGIAIILLAAVAVLVMGV